MHLTVIHPFTRQVDDEAHTYARGDKIYEQQDIEAILKGENARNVVRTFDGANGQAPQQTDLSKLH